MHKTVGMIGNEIFFAEIDPDGRIHCGGDGVPVYDVIRPVTRDQMEELQEDPDTVRDLWQGEVAAGGTELGLADFFDSLMAECYGDEDWPCKDDTFCEYLSDEDRAKADAYLSENEGMDVGSWEASGFFSPSSLDFDLLFCEPEFIDRLRECNGGFRPER